MRIEAAFWLFVAVIGTVIAIRQIRQAFKGLRK